MPLHTRAQLGVPYILDKINQLRRKNPVPRQRKPSAVISKAALPVVRSFLDKIRLTVNPASTIEGTLPSMTTPNTGFNTSSQPSKSSWEQMFNPIKKSHRPATGHSFDLSTRHAVAATK
ncbi:hypothetical protein D3C87_1757260 [compost metagenome]